MNVSTCSLQQNAAPISESGETITRSPENEAKICYFEKGNRRRLNAVSDDLKKQMALAFRRYDHGLANGDFEEAVNARARFLELSKGVLR